MLLLDCCVQILRETHGAMELLDVSNELHTLKRLPGVKKWVVRDRVMLRQEYSQVGPCACMCLYNGLQGSFVYACQ